MCGGGVPSPTCGEEGLQLARCCAARAADQRSDRSTHAHTHHAHTDRQGHAQPHYSPDHAHTQRDVGEGEEGGEGGGKRRGK